MDSLTRFSIVFCFEFFFGCVNNSREFFPSFTAAEVFKSLDTVDGVGLETKNDWDEFSNKSIFFDETLCAGFRYTRNITTEPTREVKVIVTVTHENIFK